MTDRTQSDADPDEVEDVTGREVAPGLYHDPFAGRGICAKALALAPERRGPVTQACPRCGAMKHPETPIDERPCLLEGVALDVLALEAEEEMQDVRAQLTGPLPF